VTRMSIALAVATGIPPSTWIEEGYRAMVTAVDCLEEQNGVKKSTARFDGRDDVVMGG